MASIVEKKEDLNTSIFSKNQSNEKPSALRNQLSMAGSTKNLKKSNFSSLEKRRSKSFFRERSVNELNSANLPNSSAKLMKMMSSCEKLEKKSEEENTLGNNDNDLDSDNEASLKFRLDEILRDEIMNYTKKDLTKKIKERSVFEKILF